MGKVQSKQGDCFVLNAHFNPLCQMDESDGQSVGSKHEQPSHRPSQQSQAFSCSELSLTVCGDRKCAKTSMNNNGKDSSSSESNFPLKVVLPPENNFEKSMAKEEREDKPEKAEEEKSEKEEKNRNEFKEINEKSLSDLEKQEFLFTLYDFNGYGEVTQDDISNLVRNIYSTLGKSVKLPHLGSRTIKVKLAVSPDEDENKNLPHLEQKLNDCLSNMVLQDSYSQSENESAASHQSSSRTTCTKLTASTPTKCSRKNTPHKERQSVSGQKFSPNIPLSAKHQHANNPFVSTEKDEDLVSWMQQSIENACQESLQNNFKNHQNKERFDGFTPQQMKQSLYYKHHHKHQHKARDHFKDNLDCSNHYDEIPTENCASKLCCDIPTKTCYDNCRSSPTPLYNDSNYVCPFRVLDRNHNCSKFHRNKDSNDVYCCRRSYNKLKTRNDSDNFVNSGLPKDNLLDLNFDLCDLVPDEKFDWERQHCHRRSRSYDHGEANIFHNSPTHLRYMNKKRAQIPTQNEDYTPMSPSHHHVHRHRERERERQRAMKQVANWIEKEHVHRPPHKVNERHLHYASPGVSRRYLVERHEHHHVHEHIHHHFHHYVDS